MKAIILAAGPGIKIGVGSQAIPTCLMKIGKESLLERQINILKKCGINDVLVIVGQAGPGWTEKNVNKIRDIAKKTLINPLNDITPSSSSLALGLEKFSPSNSLIIDGDTVFEESLIKSMIKNKSKNVMLIESAKSHKRGTEVLAKKSNLCAIGKNLDSDKIYSGLMRIDKALYKTLLKELSIKENQCENFTEIINRNLSRHKIKIIDIEDIEGELGSFFDFRPLAGGSFANTNVISKLIKKPSYIVKKEAHYGKEKLIDEINWIKNLPKDIKPYFPKMLDYKIGKNGAWYEMEYCNLPTMRALIIKNTINEKEAGYILKTLLRIMFSKMYNQRKSANPGGYAQKVHIQRIRERIATTIQKAPLFEKIVNAKKIVLNGKKYENLPKILKIIENDPRLLKMLEPPFLCMVHGDLHLDNFLVDISQMPMIKFVLFDPRGLDNTYDYCYDLGKIWFSIHGKYDLTHEGFYDMDLSFKDGDFIANIKFTEKQLFRKFTYLYDEIKNFVQNLPEIKKDSNWEVRTCFSEMSHFCSNLPFHLKNDNKEKMAIALYLMGVKLANELMSKYSDNQIAIPGESNYFNINSLKDYMLAKRRFG